MTPQKQKRNSQKGHRRSISLNNIGEFFSGGDLKPNETCCNNYWCKAKRSYALDFCNFIIFLVVLGMYASSYRNGTQGFYLTSSIEDTIFAQEMPFGESHVRKTFRDVEDEDELWSSNCTKFICPGFVDAHAHAPQHAFTGTGMDLPLLEWLQTYTFPHEARFSNVKHAQQIYDRAVVSHLRNGSTTVSYFATIHIEACKVLVDIVRDRGQRALVGKVNMDRNSPDNYCETTENSLRDTQTFVENTYNCPTKSNKSIVTSSIIDISSIIKI